MRLANALQQSREPFYNQYAENEAEKPMSDFGRLLKEREQQPEQSRGRELYDAYLLRNKIQGEDRRTANQRIANDLSGGNRDEYEKILRQLEKLGPTERRADLPEGVPGFEELSPGERNQTVKEMNQELKRANSATSALKLVSEMRKLQNEHPEMSKYFATAMSTDEPDLFETFMRKSGIISEKELTAIQKFRKLASELVIRGSENWGGKVTDARTKLLSMTKPGSTNTKEANDYLFDRLDEEFSPWKSYGERIKIGLKHRYPVYQDLNQPEEPATAGPGRGEPVMMSVNGKTFNIPAELMEEFLAENPGAKRG